MAAGAGRSTVVLRDQDPTDQRPQATAIQSETSAGRHPSFSAQQFELERIERAEKVRARAEKLMKESKLPARQEQHAREKEVRDPAFVRQLQAQLLDLRRVGRCRRKHVYCKKMHASGS